jgi:shikimate dehydrogenase
LSLLLGLIGAGIQASRTPAMQEHEAAEHGLACNYRLFDLDQLGVTADALPELLAHAEAAGYAGLNITYPCKQTILPLLTELSDDARAMGAVNTVVFREGRRIGHNTDWWAFAESFRHGMDGVRADRVVQLGAGGAGSATAWAALRLGAGEVRIFDSIGARAAALAAKLQARFGAARVRAVERLPAAMADADGLIHATPTGMAKHPGVALDLALLRPEMWVAEVVYFPLETELLRAAKRIGCRTLDGAGMAVYQAVEAFRLFTRLEADAERMRRHFLSLSQIV